MTTPRTLDLDSLTLLSGSHAAASKQMKMMLPLSKNAGIALVDMGDYERASRHVWHLDTAGYARAMVKTADGQWRLVRLHRFLLDVPTGMQVDHADLDKLNNTRANLRICTSRQNIANLPKLSGTSSRFKGVTWNRNARKWLAQIKIDGRYEYLGLFIDEAEAAHVYACRAQQQHGEFARVS